MTSEDFPAAHSMNTGWFALDEDGHVAHFAPGQSGALPVDALQETEAVRQGRTEALPTTGRGLDLEGRFYPGPWAKWGRHWYTGEGERDTGSTLMFLESLDPVRAEVERGEAEPLPAVRGAAVLFRQLPGPLCRRLHDSGACLGCFWHYAPNPAQWVEPPPFSALGLYCYRHPVGNALSAPFGLHERPHESAHVDQLPPVWRRRLGQVRLAGVCFARALHIQPIEHRLCSSWEPAWLTADGKRIRENVPAIEAGQAPDEYEECYREFVERGFLSRAVEIDPPRPRGDA